VLKVPNAALRWRPVGVANAKDEVAPVATGPGPGSGPGDLQGRRQRLVEELQLDAGQVARLDEIFVEQRSRFAELRELPEPDRRPRMERIRADVRQRINGMLNTEQQKRYAEIVASETGRASVAGGSGRVFVPSAIGPREVALRTGLTDGNATEVASGALAEGQEVIVGTQQTSGGAAQRPGGSAPRLPF
jgi:HlyD family secretion protein